jgi:hypothetical protein
LGYDYSNVRTSSNLIFILNRFVIITCIYAPISLAFNDSSQAVRYEILDWVINVFFIGDIIVNCMTAYYDGEFSIVRNHRVTISNFLINF